MLLRNRGIIRPGGAGARWGARWLGSAWLLLSLTPGCRCSREHPDGETVKASSPPLDAGMKQHCAAEPTPAFRLQAGARPDPIVEAVGSDLPFSVELGSGVLTDGRYAVSYLRGQSAQITVLSEQLQQVQHIDLGKLHGDPPPPRLAADGKALLIAAPTSDAGGGALQLMRWAAGELTRGANLHEDDDESKAFDLSLSGDTALLTWDAWNEGRAASQILAVTVDPHEPNLVSSPVVLSGDSTDAESPRVVPRQGGFVLGWIANGAQQRPPAAEVAPVPPATTGRTVTGTATDVEQAEHLHAVGDRARWIELLPLDARGSPVGAPLKVGGATSQVVGFDLTSGDDGSILVTWLEQRSVVGVEGGMVFVAKVDASGQVQTHSVRDSELGAGLPQFVTDAAQNSAGGTQQPRVAWLAAVDVRERLLLGALSRLPPDPETLEGESALQNASIVTRSGDRVLVARPRGRDLELSLVGCKF